MSNVMRTSLYVPTLIDLFRVLCGEVCCSCCHWGIKKIKKGFIYKMIKLQKWFCFGSQMRFELWAGKLLGETVLAGMWLSAWTSYRVFDSPVSLWLRLTSSVLFFLKQDLSLCFFCEVTDSPMGTLKQPIRSLPSACKNIFELTLWSPAGKWDVCWTLDLLKHRACY